MEKDAKISELPSVASTPWLTTNLLKKKIVLLVVYPFDKEKLTKFSISS